MFNNLTFMDMAIQLNWILTLIKYSAQIPDFGIIQICKWNLFSSKVVNHNMPCSVFGLMWPHVLCTACHLLTAKCIVQIMSHSKTVIFPWKCISNTDHTVHCSHSSHTGNQAILFQWNECKMQIKRCANECWISYILLLYFIYYT